MTRRPRRNHTPAFKTKVALAAIRGEQTLVKLSRQFDVHANQIKQWKDQLLEGATGVLAVTPRQKRRLRPSTSKRFMPKYANWHWKTIFCQGRSQGGLSGGKK